MGRRAALLVGISEYGEGFEPLPGSLKDVQAMVDILKDFEIGAFEVEALRNCSDTSLEITIEHFFSGKDTEDLLLFYFSGHGDLGRRGLANQQLHLCTHNSRKENGRLIESSALSAGFLKRQMDLSRSKQIVVILDCCYSGKIADLLTKGEGDISFTELKASGRVILASSSASKVALQERDGLSVYTRFLIEGMEGAAYRGQGDWILARNLHEHADRRFEIERKGSYHPKIIAIDTGFDLPIVRAPKLDPKLEYRREVDRIFQELDEELHLDFNGHLEDELDRGSLVTSRERLGLSEEDALAIEKKIQEPYLVRASQRRNYANYFEAALQDGTLPTIRQKRRLAKIRQNLLLGEEDSLQIEEVVSQKMNLNSTIEKGQKSSNSSQHKYTSKTSSLSSESYSLNSEANKTQQNSSLPKPTELHNTNTSAQQKTSVFSIKYQQLEKLLIRQNWREADKETYRLMLVTAGKKEGQWLSRNDLKAFPCEDLKTLDRLWIKHSDGKWGFSVQTRIWEECGRPVDGDNWIKFSERVGWRKRHEWLAHNKRTFDLQQSLPGELPAHWVSFLDGKGWGMDFLLSGGWGGCFSLYSRAKACWI